MAAPTCALLDFTAQLSPLTRISEVARLVRERHDGAWRRVSVCVNRFHPDEVCDPRLTLGELGVSGECLVFYDFSPLIT